VTTVSTTDAWQPGAGFEPATSAALLRSIARARALPIEQRGGQESAVFCQLNYPGMGRRAGFDTGISRGGPLAFCTWLVP
jgi:hypothetical protein